MFDNVIVGVDDHGRGRDAVALATALRSAGGELSLVYVYLVTSKPSPDSGQITDTANRRFATARLSELRDEWSVDAEVSCVQARSVRQGLHQVAAGRHADLLVVGASRSDEFERIFVGDDTREVLEDAPCPVAVAPPGYSAHSAAVTRIGVAYDASPQSEEALALARTLAAERHATLSAFEAVTPRLDVREGEPAEEVEQARQRLAALGDIEPRAEYDDDPATALRRYGGSLDLLVIGAHAYGPIDRVCDRSVAWRLADDAPCPLLVLPTSRRPVGAPPASRD